MPLTHEPLGARVVVWRPQPGPQTELLRCPVFEVLYGGARGGGKTDSMLGEWAQHAQIYGKHAAGRFFRRERIQLVDAIERAKGLYIPIGAQWKDVEKTFQFPNGARLTFSYLDTDADAEGYQGHAYTRVYLEELGNFPSEKPIAKLRATLRSAHGVPCRMRATANPGGPGHQWVYRRYVAPFPEGWRRIVENGLDRAFIPAKVHDNPALLGADPGYIDRLRQSGSAALVRAWLDGDWDAVEGAFFDNWVPSRHVVRPFKVPSWWTRFTAFDWGSARPFCKLWFAVSDGEVKGIRKGALVIYREWYGASAPNVGLKLNSDKLAQGILAREADGEKVAYRVADPSVFKQDDGPSIGEKMALAGVQMEPADNTRIAGWEQIRLRLDGEEGEPMLIVFATCPDLIRTLPAMQHDERRPEDLDTDAEDHCFHGDTIVRTENGLYSLRELVGTAGRVRSSDGRWHDYRSARVTRHKAPIVALTFSNGETIRCTPDHRFLTTLGWKEARAMLGQSTRSLSPIPSRSSSASGSTAAGTTFSAMAAGFIARSGGIIAGLCRRAITSITGLVGAPTIGWPIWSAFQPLSTCLAGMARKAPCEDGWLSASLQRGPGSGMAVTLAGSGIASTIIATALSLCTSRSSSSAINAAPGSRMRPEAVSVPMPASLPGGGHLESTMSTGCAGFAAAVSGRTGTTNSRPARSSAVPAQVLERGPECLSLSDAGTAEVYCLTVPDTGNFALAGGQIVANCADTLRYGCMSRPYWRAQPVKKRTIKDVYRWDDAKSSQPSGWAQ